MPCKDGGVRSLVAAVLEVSFPKSQYESRYPDNITDLVCQAIYQDNEDQGWRKTYEKLVRDSSHGRVNQNLGACVLERTGMFNTGRRRKAQCPLIPSTYTVLVNSFDEL